SNAKIAGYSNKSNRNYKNPHQQARRGFPGILVTCESGREKRCQKEALDLIHHYYYLTKSSLPTEPSSLEANRSRIEGLTAAASTKPLDEPLSLEEELAMLRKGAAAEEVLSYERNPKRPRHETNHVLSKTSLSSMKSPFTVYDTGVKGVVCIVFTLPGGELVPYDDITSTLRTKAQDDDEPNVTENHVADGVKSENERITKDATNDPPLWEPIETVRIIMSEVGCSNHDSRANNANHAEKEDSAKTSITEEKVLSTSPPGSRFILRMIPIETTCHASLNEIKVVTRALLERYLASINANSNEVNDKVKTFKVDFKRRNCSHLSRDQILEAVVPLVTGENSEDSSERCNTPKQKYAVDLSDPDFSIRIEVCKTFCGLSILPRQKWYKNFNLAELCGPTPKKSETEKLL
ncbi:hypothetical protein HJC23_012242, partial [Cyclotella cryptica]